MFDGTIMSGVTNRGYKLNCLTYYLYYWKRTHHLNCPTETWYIIFLIYKWCVRYSAGFAFSILCAFYTFRQTRTLHIRSWYSSVTVFYLIGGCYTLNGGNIISTLHLPQTGALYYHWNHQSPLILKRQFNVKIWRIVKMVMKYTVTIPFPYFSNWDFNVNHQVTRIVWGYWNIFERSNFIILTKVNCKLPSVALRNRNYTFSFFLHHLHITHMVTLRSCACCAITAGKVNLSICGHAQHMLTVPIPLWFDSGKKSFHVSRLKFIVACPANHGFWRHKRG